MMYIPVTMKPVYPTATLNSMLSALDIATCRGQPGTLDFREYAAYNEPNDALLGALNPAYQAVARLDELDPTCEMALARTVVEKRNPTANVGRTHLFRELDYREAVSAQIGQWWRELLILYEAARDAESKLFGAGGERLSRYKDVETTDGPIEMFLMAVGDIDDTWIRYPRDQPLQVDVVMKSIVGRFSELIGTLHHYGFEKGFQQGANTYGIGTMPGGSGEKLVVLPARTYDRLGRAPWRVALRNARVSERMAASFISRWDAAFQQLDTTIDAGQFWILSEGDDSILLPAIDDAGNSFASGQACLDYVTAALAALGPLSEADYLSSWDWTHQFRTLGELLLMLYVDGGDSIPLDQAAVSMTVRVRELTGESWAQHYTLGNPNSPEGDVVDTGPLFTINMTGVSPVITGTTDYVNEEVKQNPIHGFETSTLPNGLLHIGSCADVTALQMIRFMEWLETAWSQTSELLSQALGRTRKTVPKSSSVNISGTDGLMASGIINSQVDGTRLPLSPRFNRSRGELSAQQGPSCGPISADVSTIVTAGGNSWGGIDNTSQIALSTSGSHETLVNIPAIISGQMSTGKGGFWMGAGLIGQWDAANIAMAAFNLPADERLNPSHYGTEYHATDIVDGSIADAAGTGVAFKNAAETLGQNGTIVCLENAHPNVGQMRGHFMIGGNAPGLLSFTSPKFFLLDRVDTALPDITPVRADGTSATVPIPQVRYANLAKNDADGRTILQPVMKDGLTTANIYAYLDEVCNMSSVADASEIPHHAGWLWDPAYAQVVGNSNRRLSGTFDPGHVILHPYVRGPVHVFSPYVTLPEINGLDTRRERSGQVLVSRRGVDGGWALGTNGTVIDPESFEESWVQLGVDGVTQELEISTLGSVEEGPAHPVLVTPVNSPLVLPSYMGPNAYRESTDAWFHGAAAGRIASLGAYRSDRVLFTELAPEDSHFSVLPGFVLNFSISNSMAQSPFMKVGSYGLNKTNNAYMPGVATHGICTALSSPVGYPEIRTASSHYLANPIDAQVYQGEKVVPTLFNSSADSVATILNVDCPGICKADTAYGLRDDPVSWLYSVGYEKTPMYRAFGNPVEGSHGRLLNVVQNRHYPMVMDVDPNTWWAQSLASLQATTGDINPGGNYNWRATPNHLIQHPWFDEDVDYVDATPDLVNSTVLLENENPAAHVVRYRKSGLVPSPWLGGDTSLPRIVEVQYESVNLAPSVEAIRNALVEEGKVFTKGLTSSAAFLQVQLSQ